jgi:hypothetical protein
MARLLTNQILVSTRNHQVQVVHHSHDHKNQINLNTLHQMKTNSLKVLAEVTVVLQKKKKKINHRILINRNMENLKNQPSLNTRKTSHFHNKSHQKAQEMKNLVELVDAVLNKIQTHLQVVAVIVLLVQIHYSLVSQKCLVPTTTLHLHTYPTPIPISTNLHNKASILHLKISILHLTVTSNLNHSFLVSFYNVFGFMFFMSLFSFFLLTDNTESPKSENDDKLMPRINDESEPEITEGPEPKFTEGPEPENYSKPEPENYSKPEPENYSKPEPESEDKPQPEITENPEKTFEPNENPEMTTEIDDQVTDFKTEFYNYETTETLDVTDLISELATQNESKEQEIHNLLRKLAELEAKNKKQADEIKKLKGKN